MYPCLSISEILFNLLINAQPALHFNLSYSQFQEMDSLTHYISSFLQINRHRYRCVQAIGLADDLTRFSSLTIIYE